MQDLYATLNLSPGASIEDIRQSYRREALRKHPDRGGDAERMKRLNEAYAILSDTEAREQFDEDRAFTEESSSSNPLNVEHLSASGLPYSHGLKQQHQAYVAQYQQQPLTRGSARAYLKPFASGLYQDAEKKLTASHLFSFIQEQAVQLPMPTTFKSRTTASCTPIIAIDLFTQFLRGEHYGDNLFTFNAYFFSVVKQLRLSSSSAPEILLYEGILEIVSMVSAPTDPTHPADSLLRSFKKITDYFQKTAPHSMAWGVWLLQNQYFRSLFSYALHRYWQSDTRFMDQKAERAQAFDGRASIQAQLDQLGPQLSQYQSDKRQRAHLKYEMQSLRLLHQFDEEASRGWGIEHPSTLYRERAYHLLDWIPAFAGRANAAIFVNILLQAGRYFQQASAVERQPAIKMADEQLASQLYIDAFSIGHRSTPEVALYAGIHGLKAMATFQFQTERLAVIMPAFQHRTLLLADLFPVFEALQPNSNFLLPVHPSLLTIRQLLHTLMDLIASPDTQKKKRTLDHKAATILYYAYEACLKHWYDVHHDPQKEEAIRQDLMKALLSQQGWQWRDVEQHTDFPWILIDRDPGGWMRPTRALPFPKNPPLDTFQAINGLELNYKTGQLNFLFRHWTEKTPNYDKALTLFDLKEMLENNIHSAFFSLDPVDSDMFYHPFNTMRFEPAALYKTPLFHTLLLTDYLLKFFTVGQEVQGRPPYAMRSLETLLQALPEYLKKILEDFQQAPHSESLHRFWIEAATIPVAFSDDNLQSEGIARFVLGDVKMIVKKHLMKRNAQGKLIDQEEGQEGWALYIWNAFQESALAQSSRKISEPAMIFDLDQRTVFFLENDPMERAQMTGSLVLKNYEETLTRLSKQKRDDNGKIISNVNNAMLLYRVTREVAEQSGKPHHYSPEFIFAQEFTAHYNEFAQYFPEFGRLRELSRVATLLHLMQTLPKSNQAHLDRLDAKLNNTAHWQARERTMQQAIQTLRTDYQERRSAAQKKTEAALQDSFSQWRSTLSKAPLLRKKKTLLSEMRAKVGPLSFSSYSSEVAEARNCMLDAHAANNPGIPRYQLSLRESNAEIAEFMTQMKRESISKQLRDILPATFSSTHGSTTMDRWIEKWMQEDDTPLAEALTDHELSEIKQEIRSQFPSASRSDVDGALEGSRFAIDRLIDALVEQQFSKYKIDLQHEINKLENRVEREKSDIRIERATLRELNAQFAAAGLNTEPKKTTDPTNPCHWVPANVRHDTDTTHTRVVYGGVLIAPEIKVFDHDDPQRLHVVNQALTDPHQYRINAHSLAEARRTSTQVQGGEEKTNYPAYLRFYQARQETAQRQQANEAKSPTSATNTTSSSSSSSSTPPSKPPASAGGGGSRPPSPPDGHGPAANDPQTTDSSPPPSAGSEERPRPPSPVSLFGEYSRPTGAESLLELSAAEREFYSKAQLLSSHDYLHPGQLPNDMGVTFIGSRYKSYKLLDDFVLQRAGTKSKPFGQSFSFDKPVSELQTRIDKAVLPKWPTGGVSPIDTGFSIKIPKGSIVHVGDVANQGEIFMGSTRQVIVQAPWSIPGVEVVDVYSLQEEALWNEIANQFKK